MDDSIMTLEEFVFDIPLYQKVRIDNSYTKLIELLKSGEGENILVDGYNCIRRKESTFKLIQGLGDVCESYYDSHSEEYIYIEETHFVSSFYDKCGVKNICFKCQRYGDEINILVYQDQENSTIMKVGQYPSVADIHIGLVKQYDKVLEKPILKEFTKAIGLAANGVGIGSFVYLRRIFEGLVIDAYNEALQNGKVDAEQFEKQRMDEKIESLKGYLPPFIVENHGIYGILSKGIHELSEDECLAYFDCMRQSIELILDERLEQLAKKKKQEEVKKSINSIASKIKK